MYIYCVHKRKLKVPTCACTVCTIAMSYIQPFCIALITEQSYKKQNRRATSLFARDINMHASVVLQALSSD